MVNSFLISPDVEKIFIMVMVVFHQDLNLHGP